MSVNKADVLAWIFTDAEKNDLTDIFSAAKERNRTLSRIAEARNSAYLKMGSRVTLTGLSPKYLNDRVGTVVSAPRRANRKGVSVVCDVELDTMIYRSGNYYGQKIVRGVPTSCVKMHEQGA